MNTAYALGTHQGRDALWSIDLADKRDPQLLFSHPLVDVGEPVLQTDRSLLGVRYDVERPYVWYADPKLRELIDRLDKQFPNRVHRHHRQLGRQEDAADPGLESTPISAPTTSTTWTRKSCRNSARHIRNSTRTRSAG